MRLVRRLAAIAAALLVIALGVLFVAIDRVVGAAIERGGSYALGVDTRVGWVRLGLGSFGLGGLQVANPPGFEADHFLRLGGGGLDVDLGTLRDETIVVPRIALDDVEIVLEGKGRDSNVSAILRNLGRFESGKPAGSEPDGDSGRKLRIQEIAITDVVARVDVLGGGLRLLRQVEVRIPEIRLRDVGSGRPVTFAQVSDIVVKAILEAVLRSGTDLGPLGGDLRGGLQGLARVSFDVEGAVSQEALDTATRVVGEAARSGDAVKAAEEAAKGLSGAAEGAGRSVRGLLGRDPEK